MRRRLKRLNLDVRKAAAVFIDFETASPSNDSACQFAAVWVNRRGKVVETFVTNLRPPGNHYAVVEKRGKKSSYSDYHGIKPRHTRKSPRLGEVWEAGLNRAMAYLPVVAHNAEFHLPVLGESSKRGSPGVWVEEVWCTVRAVQLAEPGLKAGLVDVAARHNLRLRHHYALSDAKCAAEAARLLSKRAGHKGAVVPWMRSLGLRPGELTREGYTPYRAADSTPRHRKHSNPVIDIGDILGTDWKTPRKRWRRR